MNCWTLPVCLSVCLYVCLFVCLSDCLYCVQDNDEFVVQLLNGIGDFIDLRHGLNPHLRPDFHHMTLQQVKDYIALNGHCSALVKVLHGSRKLFPSVHTSVGVYVCTLKQKKHWTYHHQTWQMDNTWHVLVTHFIWGQKVEYQGHREFALVWVSVL